MTAWHGHKHLTRWYRPCCRLCEKAIGVGRIYRRHAEKRETRRILDDNEMHVFSNPDDLIAWLRDEDDWAYIDTAETIDPSNWGY